MLSTGFIRLILIASILALPIAYFSVQYWLKGYAFLIPLGWILFIAPIAMILFIASITISFRFIRTALSHPECTLQFVLE